MVKESMDLFHELLRKREWTETWTFCVRHSGY